MQPNADDPQTTPKDNRHNWVRYAVLAAFAALLVTSLCLTLMPDSKPQNNATSNVSVPFIPPVSVPTPTVSLERDTQQGALRYLQSPERAKRYAAVVTPKAGKLIAQGLKKGMFSPVKRYDEWKKPLKPDYVGWGGISTNPNGTFAWVYWNHGKIDYSKPITDMSITSANGDDVLFFAPKIDGTFTYWDASLSVGNARTRITTEFNFPEAGSDYEPNMSSFDFDYPTTIAQLKDTDADALQFFRDTMRYWFGDNWNK